MQHHLIRAAVQHVTRPRNRQLQELHRPHQEEPRARSQRVAAVACKRQHAARAVQVLDRCHLGEPVPLATVAARPHEDLQRAGVRDPGQVGSRNAHAAARGIRIVSQPAGVAVGRPPRLRAARTVDEQGAEAPVSRRGTPPPGPGRLPTIDEVGSVQYSPSASRPGADGEGMAVAPAVVRADLDRFREAVHGRLQVDHHIAGPRPRQLADGPQGRLNGLEPVRSIAAG